MRVWAGMLVAVLAAACAVEPPPLPPQRFQPVADQVISSTPAPTATVAPTVTTPPAPSATSTTPSTTQPTVVPSTPTPLRTVVPPPASRIALTVLHPTLAQGEVQTLVVQALTPLQQVTGSVGERRLAFWEEHGIWYALQGLDSMAALGPRRVSVTGVTSGGISLTAAAEYAVVPGRFPTTDIVLPPGQEGLLDPGLLNTEWTQLLSMTGRVRPDRLWDGPFIKPADGFVSDAYGSLRSYDGGPPGDPHQGLDIGAVAGAPVVAANSGIVVYAAEWPVRGMAVVIDHGVGVFSGYYHMSKLAVTNGATVKQGRLIGYVGESGMATGPHLHWDMVVQSVHTSPLGWLSFALPKE